MSFDGQASLSKAWNIIQVAQPPETILQSTFKRYPEVDTFHS